MSRSGECPGCRCKCENSVAGARGKKGGEGTRYEDCKTSQLAVRSPSEGGS